MLKLRRKLALGVLVAFCFSLGVFGGTVASAAPGGVLDRRGNNQAISDQAVKEKQEIAKENAARDAQVAKDSQRATLLPVTSDKYETIDQCKALMNVVAGLDSLSKDAIFHGNGSVTTEMSEGGISYTQSDILGCGIKTGSIRLWMIPYYVRYVLEFAIQMAGLVAVGGIVYGGYLYLFTGVSDDKEKGKKAIMYSVAGMVMTMVAWAVVNIVIGFLTG